MSEDEVAAFNQGRNITIGLPSSMTVMVYKSSQHAGWNTHVGYNATDTVTKEPGSFGSTNQYGSKPSLRDIADHIVDQLRHEVEEQLGLNPHGVPT